MFKKIKKFIFSILNLIFMDHNEKNFMEYLKVHILPRFKKDHIQIAMFTHSRFMRKYLNKSMDELPNNIKLTKEFDL